MRLKHAKLFLLAYTMLSQNKTVFEAEIDAICASNEGKVLNLILFLK